MPTKTVIVGPLEVNCYLHWSETSKRGVVIDPGDDAPIIFRSVQSLGFAVEAILLTHAHGDHIGAVAELKDRFSVPVYIGRGEEHFLTDPVANLSLLAGQPITAPPADTLLDDEQEIAFGDLLFTVLAVPGHSPGSIAYLDTAAGVLFCGDALFQGSIGRTDFPGCSHERLLRSIASKILPLPDGIRCFPGHGPETTVGIERSTNPFLQGHTYA